MSRAADFCPEGFETSRLLVADWAARLAEPEQRAALVRALTRLLTPPVLHPLPTAMQLAAPQGDVSRWVAARAAESTVMTVRTKSDEALVGLLILAPDPQPAHPPILHLGYLFAEAAWGKGFATELVSGLVEACAGGPPLHLLGGVDAGNPASARVLEKCGFVRSPEGPATATATFVRSVGPVR